jgi:hypothetical protein
VSWLLWAQEIPALPGTGAALGALTGLASVSGVFVWMWRMTNQSNSRVDTVTASQIKGLAADRDRAFAEREEERQQRIAAEKECDHWIQKHQELAIQLARTEVEAETYRRLAGMGPTGTASSGGATPSS